MSMSAKELHEELMDEPHDERDTEKVQLILRALSLLAAVESSEDELVLELQAGMVRNGRGGPNTLQRAAAHILALRVELASVKANCKIVYWPKDGSYPIEHTMAANKDCYEMILAQMERDRAAQPKDAP